MIETGEATARTVADAQRRLVDRLIRQFVGARPVVVLADTTPIPDALAGVGDRVVRAEPTPEGLGAVVPGESAVVWLGAVDPERGQREVVPVLAEAAALGSPVLVVLEPDDDPRPSADEPGSAAARLAFLLPGGRVLEQRVSEAVVLAESGSPGPVASLPSDASRVIARLVCCVPGELPEFMEPLDSGVRDAQLLALERAVDELRTANVRLARAHLGRYDSAAASMVHRLEERYEREREIAIENDRLYQEARRRLQQPHHVAVDRLVRLLKRIPGGSRLVGLLRRGG